MVVIIVKGVREGDGDIIPNNKRTIDKKTLIATVNGQVDPLLLSCFAYFLTNSLVADMWKSEFGGRCQDE